MKKLFALVSLSLLCAACDEEKVGQVLEKMNQLAESAESIEIPSTGIGQLDAAISNEKAKAFYTNRKITVMNAFNSDTIWHYEGRARIMEGSKMEM